MRAALTETGMKKVCFESQLKGAAGTWRSAVSVVLAEGAAGKKLLEWTCLQILCLSLSLWSSPHHLYFKITNDIVWDAISDPFLVSNLHDLLAIVSWWITPSSLGFLDPPLSHISPCFTDCSYSCCWFFMSPSSEWIRWYQNSLFDLFSISIASSWGITWFHWDNILFWLLTDLLSLSRSSSDFTPISPSAYLTSLLGYLTGISNFLGRKENSGYSPRYLLFLPLLHLGEWEFDASSG